MSENTPPGIPILPVGFPTGTQLINDSMLNKNTAFSNSECTAQEAYKHTAGRAVFASGSPFEPAEINGKICEPGQGNNAYIFPGIGLGVIASKARHITEEMFLTAAGTLAARVSDADLKKGSIYPPLNQIREVSADIATAVAEIVYRCGLAGMPEPDDLPGYIRSQMYQPVYQNYI